MSEETILFVQIRPKSLVFDVLLITFSFLMSEIKTYGKKNGSGWNKGTVEIF